MHCLTKLKNEACYISMHMTGLWLALIKQIHLVPSDFNHLWYSVGLKMERMVLHAKDGVVKPD